MDLFEEDSWFENEYLTQSGNPQAPPNATPSHQSLQSTPANNPHNTPSHQRPRSPSTNDSDQNKAIIDTLAQITSNLALSHLQSTSANPLKGHRLPTFDGCASSDFLSWKDSVVSLFDFLRWDDRSRAEYLPVILTKRAKQAYDALPKHVRADFKAALHALDQQFSLLNKPLIIRNKMLRKPQGPSESVATYTDRMMETFRQLGISDNTQMLSEYFNGLRPALQADVERGLPTSLRHAQNLAEASENTSHLTSDMTQLTSMIQKLEKKIDDNARLPPPISLNAAEYPPSGHHYPPAPDRSNYRQSFRGQSRGGRHHSFSGRQSRGYNSSQRTPFCVRCNSEHLYGEHLQGMFPPTRGRAQRSRGAIRGSGRNTCYRCGGVGHYESTCPSPSQ